MKSSGGAGSQLGGGTPCAQPGLFLFFKAGCARIYPEVAGFSLRWPRRETHFRESILGCQRTDFSLALLGGAFGAPCLAWQRGQGRMDGCSRGKPTRRKAAPGTGARAESLFGPIHSQDEYMAAGRVCQMEAAPGSTSMGGSCLLHKHAKKGVVFLFAQIRASI